jgi:hypothetical protein
MATPVNDPALLELLNGGSRAVTDPELLEQLSMTPEQIQQRERASSYAGGANVKEANPLVKLAGGAKSAFDRAAYGLGQMVPDILPEGVRSAINENPIAQFAGLTFPSSQQMQDQVAGGRAFVKEAGGWGTAGDIAGEVAITAGPANKAFQGIQAGARLLPRAISSVVGSSPVAAATTGATINAITNPDDRAGAAVGGAIGGAAGDFAGRALTKTLGGMMSNKVTPDARQLMDDGVFVPMWKGTDSKLVRGAAERAKVLPVSGDIIRGQERAAFESFNRSMAGKATPPMPVLDDAGNVLRWENSPINKSGSDAINALRNRFDDAYGALYKGRGIPVDDVYGKQTAEILDATRAYYPRIADDVGSAFKQVDDILRKGTESTTTTSPIVNQAGQAFKNTQLGHAATRPESVKQAIDVLDDRISGAYGRGDAEAAEVLKQLRSSVADLRTRGLPPEVAGQAGEINRAYASFMQLQRANASLGAQKSGLTSPSQMLNAIRANDRTPNKSGFSGGNALNQQDVLRAERVLGNRLPDTGPGTAEKLAPFIGFGAPMVLGDMGATALLGTKTGQRFLMGGLPGQAGIRQYGSEYVVPALRNFGMSVGN